MRVPVYQSMKQAGRQAIKQASKRLSMIDVRTDQTKSREPYLQDVDGQHQQEEHSVVLEADTIVEPMAVVVHSADAPIA